MDPIWLSAALSGVAALLAATAAALAALAAFRPRPTGGALPDDRLDDVRQDLGTLRTALADDLRRGRDEAGAQSRGAREDVQACLDRLGTTLDGRLGELRRDGDEGGQKLREEVMAQIRGLGELLGKSLDGSASLQKERLDEIGQAIRRLTQLNADANEALRAKVEERLETLRQENGAKLEEMRRTVDEKLQGTLEERLGEKFKLVSDQLANVFKSVGEMQTLATGVGDLKRVLTNVKARGTWAEVSLGSLLDQVLAPDQFGRNVETVRGSGERVEYAIRLPGGGDGESVWLPIDAKFPVEDYERYLEASDRADTVAVEAALKALEGRIKAEGAKICAKYVSPPHTTDFGVLYLPTEGLYAEVLRRPGLVDHLQLQCKIMVAGPSNLHAFLNSLRMGFRTLAIEKRSSEVWQTLGAVKTEFAAYGDILDKVKKKLGEASNHIDSVGRRSRAIERKLRGVESLAEPEAANLLAIDRLIDDAEEVRAAAE